METMRNLLLIALSLMLLTLSACERGKKVEEIEFNYQDILRREYRNKYGKVIPVTIEQAIEIDGVFTRDGLHFFYSSDRERGNYDIYLRSLTGITTVRITHHPSKDTSPSISPNGKYLVFVSQREDPEGDIYQVTVDPAEMLERAGKSITAVPSLDSDARNLTQYQDPVTRTVRIIKDASPCWSPDGRWIAFSSNRDGAENIWIMNRKGEELRRITEKGGMYPRFSDDGQSIIFISYREEGKNGDVYTVDMKSGRERRITDTRGIELYPTFLGSTAEIVYTLIDRDTNANGKLDLRDNSILYYKNLRTGLEYPLTLYSQTSFSPKWYPVFQARDRSYRGVILYSDQIGQNININVIPEYGIIPKRENAGRQFEWAYRYLDEFDDIERHVLCLERVYHFFGESSKRDSIIYVSKSLIEAAKLYREFGYRGESKRIQNILSSLSRDRSDYRSIASRYLKMIFSGNPGDSVFRDAIERMKESKDNFEFIPYLMEDLGSEYVRLGRTEKAIDTYRQLITTFPRYRRLIYIHLKLGRLTSRKLGEAISPYYLKVFEAPGFPYLKDDAIKELTEVFIGEKDIEKRISVARSMLRVYEKGEYLPGLLHYIIGESYRQLGNLNKSKEHLKRSLTLVKKNNLIFYRSSVLLGGIAETEKKIAEAERFYFPAAYKYYRRWKQQDIRRVIDKLIRYYEEYGERAELAGDYEGAVELYRRYVQLLTTVHVRIKELDDIYSEYGSRAHVLYVDAYAQWKGDNQRVFAQLEDEYRNEKRRKNARLNRAIFEFDKAHIYALGYIYTKMAVLKDGDSPALSGIEGLLRNFRKAIEQIDWALFFDDAFTDSYILKGWIYQYVDLERMKDLKATGGRGEREIGRFFPKHLWESNIPLYERALKANDETRNPEAEGNLYLNTANIYFLLENYPRSLSNYEMAKRYKKRFNSSIEEALFHFHLGYCYWQTGKIDRAEEEMNRSLFIYQILASGKNLKRYRYQFYYLYRYFALFRRALNRYQEAIDWYNRILDFAHRYDIAIDRARYLQEIAFCYKELGEMDRALAYLDRAHRALKGYEDVEKKYPIQIKIFGLLPVSVWDLGPDAMVIGDNKLHGELDRYHKRLLNISLQEDISFKTSDYATAIRYLRKKLEILRERDYRINKEGIIRTLNNIGFCFFRLRRYKDAGEYFRRAWKYAAAPEVNDLEGMFRSVMNVTNLFVFTVEHGIAPASEILNESKNLISRVSEYRESYEKNRMASEMERLREDAKKQNRELREEEIVKLRERVTNEAEDIYYTLDIAIGVLKYYRAEILYNSEIEGEEKGLDGAFGLFTRNRMIYALYADARNRFEIALRRAKGYPSKRLLVKLLLNLGSCLKRIDYLDEAYESYSGAEKIARRYEYHDLHWQVYLNLARFISEYGERVEGKNYLSISEDYFKRAMSMVEQSPILNGGNTYRVRELYDEYMRFLLRKGEWKRALVVSENKHRTIRAIMIAAASPRFFDREDSRDFEDMRLHLRDIDVARKSITSLLELGETEPQKITPLRDRIKESFKLIREMNNRVKKRGSILHSYFSTEPQGIPRYDDVVIYKFFDVGGKIHSWRIVDGTVDFQLLKESSPDASSYSLLTDYLEKDQRHAGKQRFVVLNESILDIIRKGVNAKTMPPFMFVPSVDRIKFYLSFRNLSLRSIYFNGSGLQKELSKSENLRGLRITEEERGSIDFSDFSVIIDSRDGDDSITPSVLFARRLEPSLLIKRIDDFNIDYLNLLIESSLYAGVRTLILYRDTDVAGLRSLLENAFERSYTHVNSAGYRGMIGIGFRGFERRAREARISGERDDIFMRYRSGLKDGNLPLARMYLNRWYEMGGYSPKEQSSYLLNAAEIEYLNESFVNASDLLRKAAASSREKRTEEHIHAIANQIYMQLYTGKISEARELLNRIGRDSGFKKSKDFYLFQSIMGLLSGGIGESKGYYEKSKESNYSVLPENRLKLLYAEYLNLFDHGDFTAAVLSDWKQDYPLSDREALKVMLLKGEKGITLYSENAQGIAAMDSIGDPEELKKRSALSVSQYGRYGSLSPFSVYLPSLAFIKRNRYDALFSLFGQADISELVRNSDWKDAIPLLSLVTDMYISNGRYREALGIMDVFKQFLGMRELPAISGKILYKQSITLSKMRNYKRSYEIAKRGFALVDDGDELYVPYQLLLMENEIFLGMIENAQRRGARIESGLRDEYRYVLYLLRSNIVRHRILRRRKATDSDLNTYEGLVAQALGILDRSPDILQRFNRIDLIKRGLDFIIRNELGRRNVLKALMYAELRKQLIIRSKFPGLTLAADLPREAVDEFKGITMGEGKEKRFVELLRKYPLLQVTATAHTVPIEFFQRLIPKNTVAFYMVENENDIFTWVIDERRVVFRVLRNGFSRFQNIQTRYSAALSQHISTIGVSRELYTLFKPLERYYRGKEMLIIITDDDLESVPFEIIGKREMIDETHTVVYLSSILSALRRYNTGNRVVSLLNADKREMYHELELVALRESGISYRASQLVNSGMGHIHRSMLFDPFRGEFFLNEKRYHTVVGEPEIIYLPSHFVGRSYNDIALFSSFRGIRALIINDAVIHDVNNAVFVDAFYREIREGGDFIEAFQRAKHAIRDSERYNHPAYWAGIKIYLNGL